MKLPTAALYAGQCDCVAPTHTATVTGQCDCATPPHAATVTGQCDCATPLSTPPTLSAWLHLTDRCNLRCDYCYLPHLPVDMSIETGRAIIRAAMRSAHIHSYQRLHLKYAGGEPLLTFPLLIGLHRYAQCLADRYGIVLEGTVLSNGTLLTTVMAQTMQQIGLHLVVSLDTLDESCARQRTYAHGRDSSLDAIHAIELAYDQGLQPTISITVSGRNAPGLSGLMEWVLERDLLFSLNFYREHTRSVKYPDLHLDQETIIAGMLAAYRVIEARLPRQSLLTSLVDQANLALPHRYTCGVGHNYMVFDAQGRVSKCQMHQEHIVATAQAIDPLALVCADTRGIQNLPVDEKETCRSCRWKYWCAGGCPLATYRATGHYDRPSPHCTLYQILYPHAVRLEKLRVLKYATFENCSLHRNEL